MGSIPEFGRSLEQEVATNSSVVAWKIPWAEEPGRLQFMALQRVGQDCATEHAHTHCVHVFHFSGYCQTIFQTVCQFQLFRTVPYQHLTLAIFSILVILVCMQRYHIKGLICISQMTNVLNVFLMFTSHWNILLCIVSFKGA